MNSEKISANVAKLMGIKKQSRYARVREPDEVPPRQIDIMHSPVYVPPKIESVRAGADDHKKYKSIGVESGSATYLRGHK